MVDDDLFISKTYSNWYFGGDNTGNIMNQENVTDLKDKIESEVSNPLEIGITFLQSYYEL